MPIGPRAGPLFAALLAAVHGTDRRRAWLAVTHVVETEMNSVTDNPLIDAETARSSIRAAISWANTSAWRWMICVDSSD